MKKKKPKKKSGKFDPRSPNSMSFIYGTLPPEKRKFFHLPWVKTDSKGNVEGVFVNKWIKVEGEILFFK